jgi:hypothetical protein
MSEIRNAITIWTKNLLEIGLLRVKEGEGRIILTPLKHSGYYMHHLL